jgi:hypothetical protein
MAKIRPSSPAGEFPSPDPARPVAWEEMFSEQAGCNSASRNSAVCLLNIYFGTPGAASPWAFASGCTEQIRLRNNLKTQARDGYVGEGKEIPE